jgi:hypothetical protein
MLNYEFPSVCLHSSGRSNSLSIVLRKEVSSFIVLSELALFRSVAKNF